MSPELAAAYQIRNASEQIAQVSVRLHGLLADPRMRRSVAIAPDSGSKVMAALTRVVTGTSRLGCRPLAGRPASAVANAPGGNSLVAEVTALAMRLRIRAAVRDHAELDEDRALQALIEAVEDRRLADAAATYQRIKDTRGTAAALSAVAPVFIELSGLITLLNGNPSSEPFAGASMDWVSAFEAGGWRAERVQLPPEAESELLTDGSVVSHLRNIAAMRPYGYVLLHTIACHDGKVRYFLELPGIITTDGVRSESAQDLPSAIRGLQLADTAYTRAMAQVFADARIPGGAELAMLGHSQGGVAAMNLAGDPDFVQRYRLTHVVAVGSPVDHKQPADPDTWIASAINEHDIVPMLAGRGPGTPYNPQPDWYEVSYADPTHGFPACHSAERYAENLRSDIPAAAAHIDAQLARYRGQVTAISAFQLIDE